MSNIISTETTGIDLPAARAEMGVNVKARTPDEEVWAIQVPGRVSLRVTQFNRFGQPVEAILVMGPNRAGQQFRIKTVDREENQARCMAVDNDPFRNGMLVRIDADQQGVPETHSGDALTTEQLLEIYDLATQRSFEKRVKALGEVPLRRLAEVGESMDCSHLQIEFVRGLLDERYSRGGPQATLDVGEHEKTEHFS
jgi:hypothetical protein